MVKNERRQSVDNQPYGMSEEALLANVFPKGHPYSWSVIGSMKDLDAASLQDLRRFFGEFYHPGNAAALPRGRLRLAAVAKDLDREILPLDPRRKAGQEGGRGHDAAAGEVEPRLAALVDQVSLPRLYWAWPTVANDHPDAPALVSSP